MKSRLFFDYKLTRNTRHFISYEFKTEQSINRRVGNLFCPPSCGINSRKNARPIFWHENLSHYKLIAQHLE